MPSQHECDLGMRLCVTRMEPVLVFGFYGLCNSVTITAIIIIPLYHDPEM